MMDHPIITLQDALEQGMTSSEARTISRCLLRIAATKDDNQNFNPAVNRRNAYLFRQLANEIDRARRV